MHGNNAFVEVGLIKVEATKKVSANTKKANRRFKVFKLWLGERLARYVDKSDTIGWAWTYFFDEARKKPLLWRKSPFESPRNGLIDEIERFLKIEK